MAICSLCLPALRIPSRLPVIPDSWNNRVSVLEDSSTPCFLADEDGATPYDQVGLPHLTGLDLLALSSQTCPLCRVILQKVESIIAEFKKMEENTFLKYAFFEGWGQGLPEIWTFKLVQRLDGADGFSIIINSKKQNLFFLLDAFGFCVEPGQSMYSISNQNTQGQRALSPGRVRGARVDPDAGSKEPLKVVTGWTNDCVINHDCCRPPQVPLPSRILDLNAFDDPGRIRLCETRDTTNYDSYVTLSYCWGTDSSCQVRTTHATLSDHLDSITVQDLPQTYQDAIKITRHLGIQFLWIDSLCICQDDVDDWVMESAAMQQVYAGSYLTIAADNARRSTDGFLKRPERSHVPIILQLTRQIVDSASVGYKEVAAVPGYAFEIPPSRTINTRSWLTLYEEPLTLRAWATQERLLPQRTLHFGKDQLFFECNHHFLSEDGIEVLGRWNSLRPGGKKSFEDLSRKSRHSAIHKLWYLILEDYTGRLLTVKTDRLPAISGLAELIKVKLNEATRLAASGKPQSIDYVVGLWSDALVEGLGWSTLETRTKDIVWPDERPLPGEEGYIAPTWSPASLDGRSGHGTRLDGWIDLAVVTGFSVTPKNTQNPFGEVVDGWISMRAPMVKVGLSEQPEVDEATLPEHSHRLMRLCTPRGDRFGEASFFDGIIGQTEDTRSWVGRSEISALFLSEGKYLEKTTETHRHYHALLVIPITQHRPARTNERQFRRVGTIFLDSECLRNDEEVLQDVDGFVDVILL
ncbi:hypothetical protein FSARC_7672 [Fusarium sarcochroum]|uniref:Heterokaryon incompatibility domain-containing protein n=1 Tax=Fusarium sarcochroum TaxID=1208366 RepID=A0A8H4TUS5_9HYPO|nr:hypothetical protein FSARC_7672 [Fusarium sarcochroum]